MARADVDICINQHVSRIRETSKIWICDSTYIKYYKCHSGKRHSWNPRWGLRISTDEDKRIDLYTWQESRRSLCLLNPEQVSAFLQSCLFPLSGILFGSHNAKCSCSLNRRRDQEEQIGKWIGWILAQKSLGGWKEILHFRTSLPPKQRCGDYSCVAIVFSLQFCTC